MVPVKSWKNLSPFGSIWYWCSKNNDKIQRDQPSKVSQVHQLTKLLFHCISEQSADTLCHVQSHIPCTKNIIYTNSKLTWACKLEVSLRRGGGGGGGGQNSRIFHLERRPPPPPPPPPHNSRLFHMERLRPEVKPLILLYTIFDGKVLLSYTFYWQMEPFFHT